MANSQALKVLTANSGEAPGVPPAKPPAFPPRSLRSGVEGRELDCRNAVNEPQAHLPGVAAHFAIFNVLLKAATARIYRNRYAFAAVRAGGISGVVGCAVAERELIVDIRVVTMHG